MTSAPAAGAIAAGVARDRRRAKRRAAWRRRGLVLVLMSPWLVGFTVFFAYPLVMSAYLSFTHYDLLSAPRWVGTANYHYLFEQDQRVWPAVKNTLWMMVVFVPLQVLFAFGLAQMLMRARHGAGVFRTIFYLPALAPTVAATLGFVYLLNPGTGPVNVALERLGIPPALVRLARVVEAIARPARALGHRNDDDHLPGRARRRTEAALRVGEPRRRELLATDALGDIAVDQPSDLVRRSSSG